MIIAQTISLFHFVATSVIQCLQREQEGQKKKVEFIVNNNLGDCYITTKTGKEHDKCFRPMLIFTNKSKYSQRIFSNESLAQLSLKSTNTTTTTTTATSHNNNEMEHIFDTEFNFCSFHSKLTFAFACERQTVNEQTNDKTLKCPLPAFVSASSAAWLSISLFTCARLFSCKRPL